MMPTRLLLPLSERSKLIEMTVLGDISPWADTFPQQLVPTILELIVQAWVMFGKPTQGELETQITRRFRAALVASKNLRRLPLRIDREVPEDDLSSAEEKGRIDLRFTSVESVREEVYFAIECKRLNSLVRGRFVPLAGSYVRDGMQRFVRSQYSASQPLGGMIGYVLNGDVKGALERIERNLRRQQERLRLEGEGLHASTILLAAATLAELRETHHRLERGVFCLHHLLLPC